MVVRIPAIICTKMGATVAVKNLGEPLVSPSIVSDLCYENLFYIHYFLVTVLVASTFDVEITPTSLTRLKVVSSRGERNNVPGFQSDQGQERR